MARREAGGEGEGTVTQHQYIFVNFIFHCIAFLLIESYHSHN